MNPSGWKPDFVEKMRARIVLGELRYGPVEKAAPHYDYIKNAIVRLREYERTGNTEFLVDAANFALLEYACPSHPDAHFRATDHDESPRAVKA